MDTKTHIHIYIYETPLFTQAHTHKCTQANLCVHTRAHSHAYRCTHIYMHIFKLACKLFHVHLYTHVLAHIHLHTNSHVHICKYRHVYIYSHLHTTHGNPHEHMCIHYTCFCTCTHTHMYMMVICDLFNMVITTPGLRPTMKPETSQFLPFSMILISSWENFSTH